MRIPFIAGISRETTDGRIREFIRMEKFSVFRDIVDIERESREKKLERSGPSGASVCFSRRKKRKKRRKKTVVEGREGGRVTVVSHFREILNCELREREERGKREREREEPTFGEYRRDMHYTMDARFSRLISLNFAVSPPFSWGIVPVIEVENQICENIYVRARAQTRTPCINTDGGLTRLLCRADNP